MILKALYDYYIRKGDLAPFGMEYKEIAFLIVINANGKFVRIEDRRLDNKSSQKFLVIKGMRAGTTPKPYLFWDNVEYTLNYSKMHIDLTKKESQDFMKIKIRNEYIKKVASKNNALVEKYKSIARSFPNNSDFKAVCLFYDNNGIERVKESPLWDSIIKKPTVNISYMIDGKAQIVAEDADLQSLILSREKNNKKSSLSICLITGKKAEAVELTTPTAISGGQATGRLVAFQVNSGYDSYGKLKGFNAPISKEAEFSYTTALNKLLAKDSHNKFLIGNRTFLFWASSITEASVKVEESLFSLLRLNDETDDPNRRIEQVRKVFSAIYSGILRTNVDDRFYFLGLAPNAARIAVVYWNESTLKDFAKRILDHFNDMEIIDARKDKKPYYGLYQIIGSVSLNGKISDVKPNLPDTVIKSIVQGKSYPYTLLMACIERIRAEQQITICRAAVIKAYLNRLNDNNKKIKVMVDKENINQGYLCGRLFATLEYLQERSNNGNNTIRSRYMNAASATPAVVFSTLLNLSVHHSEKLDRGGQIYFEQIKSEIMDKLSSDGFPTHLSLQDQGRFMVGCYQQRQEFYSKRNDIKENNVEQ